MHVETFLAEGIGRWIASSLGGGGVGGLAPAAMNYPRIRRDGLCALILVIVLLGVVVVVVAIVLGAPVVRVWVVCFLTFRFVRGGRFCIRVCVFLAWSLASRVGVTAVAIIVFAVFIVTLFQFPFRAELSERAVYAPDCF